MSDDGVILREPEGGDLCWLGYRHMQTVAKDFGWNRRFEGYLAEIFSRALLHFDPAKERFWVAERDGRLLGCVGLARENDVEARLRVLFVEPEARGLGLGRRLIETCLEFARQAGYREVALWTLDVLQPARRLYAEFGFVLESAEPWDDIGPTMQDEQWRLTL